MSKEPNSRLMLAIDVRFVVQFVAQGQAVICFCYVMNTIQTKDTLTSKESTNMTKVEIDGDMFQVRQHITQDDACLNCYFCSIACPLSDEWPYNAICSDYDGEHSYAYFKRIK